MEAWLGLGLIGVLLFLIHDDEAEVAYRREYRRAGTYSYLSYSSLGSFIFIEPFPKRQSAVENGYLIAETRLEYRNELRREGYLGHHHDDALAVLNRGLDELEEHRGLARAGDAVQQGYLTGIPLIQLMQFLISLVLFLGEHDLAAGSDRCVRHAEDLVLVALDQALTQQSIGDGRSDSGVVAYLFHRSGTHRTQKLDDVELLRAELHPIGQIVDIVAEPEHTHGLVAYTPYRGIAYCKYALGGHSV